MIDPSLIMGAVQGGIGIVQSLIGAGQKRKARAKADKLMSERKAFITPEETMQALQASQWNAQTGMGGDVLKYLTGNADKTFSSSVGAVGLNGGDANDLMALFNQRAEENLKIAGQDTAARMANFSKLLTSLATVADNKAAEQVSKDNLLKDRIQGAVAEGGEGTKNGQSGLNGLLAGASTIAMGQLYKNKNDDNFYGLDNYYNTAGASVSTAIPSATGSLIARGVTSRPR